MDPKQAAEVATWAKAESLKLEETWPRGSQVEKELMAKWRRDRPQMVAALNRHQALPALAHVLIDESVKAEKAYLRAGMPPPDAREQAMKEWLLQTPESDDESEGVGFTFMTVPRGLPPLPAGFGTNNKFVTRERAEELRVRLRAKLRNQPSSNIDPQKRRQVTGRLSESEIIAQVSQRICERIARRVIAALQAMDDVLLSGEGSGLRNTWEEICVQLQHEESIYWQSFEETVRALVDGLVAALLAFEREAVWLQTPEGVEWSIDEVEDRLPSPVDDSDITDFILRDFVYVAAANWSNVRIRAYIERSYQTD